MMDHAYIGRCKCGQIVGAKLDNPDHLKAVSAEVSRWIREGLTIERVTNDYVRENFGQCQCECDANYQQELL